MAGVLGLKIVLLLGGIIALVSCQDTASESVSTPPRTEAAATAKTNTTTVLTRSSTPPSPSSNSSIQGTISPNISVTSPSGISNTTRPTLSPSSQSDSSQNLTSPAVTQNTTITTSPAPPQCSYNVKKIKFGLQFQMNYTIFKEYHISVNDGNNLKNRSCNENTTCSITGLKPCTDYTVIVNAQWNDTEIFCPSSENKVTTESAAPDDIKVSKHRPGHVCYQSDWDISNSLSTPDRNKTEKSNGSVCFKLKKDDFCSSFTVDIKSESCETINITKDITIDFIDPAEIDEPKPTKLPVRFEPKLPPNCKNLTVEYTCLETRLPGNRMNLSVLEPYTDYNCTGEIKNETFVFIRTPPVIFNIDCGFNIKVTSTSDNTSIQLDWTSTNSSCGVDLPKLSYICSCDTKNQIKSRVESCVFTGLEPYTDYTCEVHPKYNDKKVNQGWREEVQTDAGVPTTVEKLRLTVPENNVIDVECDEPKKLYGPKREYKARLHDSNGFVKEEKSLRCYFPFKDLSYSTTYRVEVTVYNGAHESPAAIESVNTSYNDKAVIGFLVFLIIITSVALLLVVYKIYVLKRKNSHDMGESMNLIEKGSDEENLMTVDPIAAEVLLETYKRKLADEGRLFLAEFQSIPRIFSRYSVKEAKKHFNGPKNRYVDILPYDHNRVQLSTGNGEPGCDYINASFIDGYKEPKKYIAAQGPKDETVSDFWRMVWEQQSSIIVMVTRCEEGNRVKCAQYWPSQDRETEIYEEFIVKLTSEKEFPDYTIRHLRLTNKREKNSEREVTHIQFISWPDHGVPGEPQLLLKLRRRVNAFKNFFSGPIVVHCSAGVGRTGTYIGIDAMMEGLEAEGRVDIYGYVVRLRRQRCLMVQVEAQYILIHQALLEHNQFGETEISLSELHSTVSTLKQGPPESESTLMEEEFERLPSFKTWRTCNTGVTEENKAKNRCESVIPYDYNRVLLRLDEGRSHDSDPDEDEEEESSDEEEEESAKYINASYIDGYWDQHAFITTQTPLPDTVNDFWQMIYQKRVPNVVMLSECEKDDKDCESVYWDKEKKTFGYIEVEVTNTETFPAFVYRTMKIRHIKRSEVREVNHVQFLKWDKELPEKPQDLIDMIKHVKSNCGSGKSQKGMPVLAHCNDGSTRSGVFCALWNLLDSAENEKLVDVFQVVKTLRKERQKMISSLEQYTFLYSALESTYPVQNGEAKPVQATGGASVQVINETKAEEQQSEKAAERPASTTSNDQQAAAESSPVEAEAAKEDSKEEPEKEVSNGPTEAVPVEDTSNGPTVTVEV
ncbi:receptor-type tyrosine-protein phosphatase C isoform X2 [Oryzias melastigma]|uniref:receptor-type tyrosine-protein phosphatase C isoform X2 n=1 Tax=Oryzias melastigma TaxID=30732 RepID=UPI00168D7588|nr:receptor-type tyrosine-protein phosphatase C isoform X2 [Oryzias melastigma]